MRAPDGSEGLAPVEHLVRPDLPEAKQAMRDKMAADGEGPVFRDGGVVRTGWQKEDAAPGAGAFYPVSHHGEGGLSSHKPVPAHHTFLLSRRQPLVAMHAFTPGPKDAGQLSIQPGDRLTLVTHVGNGWLMARMDKDGQRGMVPEAYVAPPEIYDARQLPEFYGSLSAFQLDHMFADQEPGTYCIHSRPDAPGELELTVKWVGTSGAGASVMGVAGCGC